jgi:NAD(P)-dependent dehydrogenase (short-subunit alcohol dehydrogenase family)
VAGVLDVNLDGVWHCCQAFGGHMAGNGGGSIVNIGSMSAHIVNRPQWQPAYNASKAAVHHLTRSLAAGVGAAGYPGQRARARLREDGHVPSGRTAVSQHWIEDAPMRRYASPEEIAPSVVFLASDASSFMTGAVLVVDGGYTAF